VNQHKGPFFGFTGTATVTTCCALCVRMY